MNTFTKSLASTIRISYMVLPPHLVSRFVREFGFYACTVSTFEQYTLARFIRDGYFEKHINRTRNYYRNVRDALLRALKASPLASQVTVTEANAGLHFLLKLRHCTLSDTELTARAAKRGMQLTCLSQYMLPAPGSTSDGNGGDSHVLVINYSGLSPEEIPDAVDILSQILLSA